MMIFKRCTLSNTVFRTRPIILNNYVIIVLLKIFAKISSDQFILNKQSFQISTNRGPVLRFVVETRWPWLSKKANLNGDIILLLQWQFRMMTSCHICSKHTTTSNWMPAIYSTTNDLV